MDPDLDRLGFLLAGLRESPPSKEAERRLVAEFQRLWPPPAKAEDRACEPVSSPDSISTGLPSK